MPRLQEVDGCVGLSLLADQQTGRCIVTTAWETEEAMRASAEQIAPVRDQAAQAFGAIGSPTIEEWEIAVLHRDHRSGEGACARATWVKLPPDQLDQGIEFYKTSVLPDARGTRRVLQRQPAGRSRFRTRRVLCVIRQPRCDGIAAESRQRPSRTRRPEKRAPTSSTTASSSFGSPICGRPSWSDRGCGVDRPSRVIGCRPVLPCANIEQAHQICPLSWPIQRRKVWVGPVAPPGRC